MAKKENNNRKFPDGTRPRPDLSDLKRREAKDRQDAYDGLSIEQKLAALDTKLGAGEGAKRQRARLATLLEKKNAPASSEVVKMAQEAGQDMLGLINDDKKKHLKAKDRRRQERKDPS